jgi:SAM-dependent methyltransferase
VSQSCPLCHSSAIQPYFEQQKRAYLSCKKCELVFLSKSFYLTESQQKSRYDKHQNHPDNENYRDFLSKLATPLLTLLPKNDKVLDFGCGAGSALPIIFKNQGFQMDLFDKFYANNPEVFSRQYDFITATEVFEHLEYPAVEIKRLFGLLTENGVLGVMTQLLTDEVDFKRWYYKNDPTHICFFRKNTLRYLADKYQTSIEFYGDNVIIFSKNPTQN